MKPPPRTRYFAGPEVWTLAQEAYLRGESAGSIARRLNLTVNGIRKRAARKGWTRTQHAEALKRNEHPAQTLGLLIARIGRLAHEGRVDDIGPLVETANRLAHAVRSAPPPPPQVPSLQAQREWRQAETRRLQAGAWAEAQRLARAMLSQNAEDVSGPLSLPAYHWRARTLGPDVALADFKRGVGGGWGSAYWDARGRLKPMEAPPEPDRLMVRQHLGQSRGVDRTQADMGGWTVPAPAQADPATVPTPALDAAPTERGPRIRRL